MSRRYLDSRDQQGLGYVIQFENSLVAEKCAGADGRDLGHTAFGSS